MYPSLECRFWSKVYKTANCWFWVGNRNLKDGYGRIWTNRKNRRAHIVSWELHHKTTFPDGKSGLHTCDIKQCVRPDHVFPGTEKENCADSAKKGMHRGRLPRRELS